MVIKIIIIAIVALWGIAIGVSFAHFVVYGDEK